jgi:hypothetical protein
MAVPPTSRSVYTPPQAAPGPYANYWGDPLQPASHRTLAFLLLPACATGAMHMHPHVPPHAVPYWSTMHAPLACLLLGIKLCRMEHPSRKPTKARRKNDSAWGIWEMCKRHGGWGKRLAMSRLSDPHAAIHVHMGYLVHARMHCKYTGRACGSSDPHESWSLRALHAHMSASVEATWGADRDPIYTQDNIPAHTVLPSPSFPWCPYNIRILGIQIPHLGLCLCSILPFHNFTASSRRPVPHV